MPFERIGLGGHLTFEEAQAVAALRKATQSFDALLSSATRASPPVSQFAQRFRAAGQDVTRGTQMMRSGIGQMKSGFMGLTLGMAPVSAAMGVGVSKAASFEKQMSGVSAITRATTDEMAMLTAEAKRQGIVSVFSASQSAEAMENLGRAGFSTTEILDGLGGVMNAAAAEGVDLATSSDIIARVVRGMGEEVKQASHIADILALTSAKSNTNIVDLGESFKYGAAQAKSMGISTEETAAVFGKLADAGLRGSVGGTAFTNMMVKLTKPTAAAAKQMKEWKIKLTDSTGALLPIADIVDKFSGRLNKISDTAERARIMTELFGIRGAKAYSSLALAGGDALRELTQDMLESSFGVGAAQEAASKRLDNFLGAMTLFGSSLEAVSIEFFGPMLKGFQSATEGMTESLNHVLLSVQGLKQQEESFGIVASRVGREQGRQLAERNDLISELSKREQKRTEVLLGALTKEAIMAGNVSDTMREDMTKRIADTLKLSKRAGALTEERRRAFAEEIAQSVERTAMRKRVEVEARSMLENEQRLLDIEREHGPTARVMAEGVLAAIESIKQGFQSIVDRVKGFAQSLRESIGDEQLQKLTQIAATVVAVAGAMVPVLVTFGMFSFLVKSAITPVIGLGKVVWGLGAAMMGLAKGAATGISAMIGFVGKVGGLSNVLTLAVFKMNMGLAVAFAAIKGAAVAALVAIKGAFVALLPFIWPVVLVVGALVGGFLLFRKEGESVGETLTRAWESIKTAVLDTWNNVVKPVLQSWVEGWKLMAEGLYEIWLMLWEPIKEIAGQAMDWVSSSSASAFEAIGGWVDTAIGWFTGLWDWIVSGAQAATAWLVDTFPGAFKFIGKWIGKVQGWWKDLWQGAADFIRPFVDWVIQLFDTKLGRSIKKIFTGLADVVTTPFRLLLRGLLRLADALPSKMIESVVSADTLKMLRDFSEHGFAGPPEKSKETVKVVHEGAKKIGREKGAEALTALKPAVRREMETRGMEATPENVRLARAIVAERAKIEREKKARERKAAADKELKAQVQIEDKRTIAVNNKMCVDGEGLSVAKARHEQSVFERSGGRTTPFVRRRAAESGTRVAATARA